MKQVRVWSVRHARALEHLLKLFQSIAPLLRPGVAKIGARRVERLIAPVERAAKGFFFDCHMCGRCTLSSTGMACPMNCPKSHRNGPCGGVGADGSCEMERTMRCVWLEALDGTRRMQGGQAILRIQPPVDRRLNGSSAWVRMIMGEEPAVQPAAPGTPEATAAHAPGSLERACRSGRFVVAAELSPPDSADPAELLRRAAALRGLVDAINLTDGAGANCHMSSLAASAVLAANGYAPVFQIACRDRNRIAIQGDILGASALGVRNLLCVTGDSVGNGDHPDARDVFDLDAVSLLEIARGMRDRGTYASGRRLGARPALFLGATSNPFAPPFEARVINLEKKIEAGAQFIQTQYCFDAPLLQSFMREARARDLHRRCRILVGVGPLASARAARWMVAHVPGVHIPEGVIRRMEQSKDAAREGVRICAEIIGEMRAIEGIAGAHIMAHRREDLVREIIAEAGIASVPAPDPRGIPLNSHAGGS